MKKLLLIAAAALWFAGCSDRGEVGGNPREGVAIAFSLDCGALSASVGAAQAQPAQTVLPATRAAVPIASGTTVRIVALHAGDALGSTPAASATYYVTGEETADGHKRATLAPCTVTNDGTTGAVTAYTPDATQAMRLKAGKYDFYAFSPALKLNDDGKSVDVYHATDFAASTTAGVTVKSDGTTSYPDPLDASAADKTGTSGAVELKTFVRRCTLVSFSVEPKTASAFNKLTISSVQLTKMTDQPAANTAVDGAIAPGGNEYAFTFPSSAFKPGAAANLWSFESPVLPKIKDTYGLKISVLYNDNTKPVDLATTTDQIPAMAFLAGYRYSFTLKLKGASLQLILSVSDWNEAGAWEDPDGIGAYPGMEFLVGEWKDCFENDNTGIGGFLNPGFTTPENWSENKDLNDQIGAFLDATASQSPGWGNASNDNTDTGLQG
ncbi:MAG: fimbrillin family protein [Alistipes senegalensis]|nr:fimbrillin family protein [Bacteroides cellulosilyticus]MCM1352986.1 fimbrillin family protein [Alistipes senegalensis]